MFGESTAGFATAFAERARLYLRVTTIINALLSAVIMVVIVRLTAGNLREMHKHMIGAAWGVTALNAMAWFLISKSSPSAIASNITVGVNTVILTAFYTYGATRAVPANDKAAALFSLLIVTIILVLRSSLVPSPATVTAIIGALCVAFPGYAARPVFVGDDSMFLAFFWSLAGIVVAVTTVTSHTVYGLEQRMRAKTQLGPYRLSRAIGSGGMGQVFLAEHAMLHRPTAIKLLRDSSQAAARERFHQEVQAASTLNHPNTVDIYDYGRTPEGVFYFAMEYVEGATLEQIVRATGPLPPERVVFLLLQAAGSIGEAHSRGLVHRDIKPSNLMLCERGGNFDTLKVLDFGLVRDISDEADSAAGDDEQGGGSLTGTPLYLAPETILDEHSFSPQSDVYALGATAYFLLAGHAPFQGPTLVDVLADHLSTAPSSPGSEDEKLNELILASLAKDPSQRPQDAREFALRLETCAAFRQWKQSDANIWWSEHREVIATRCSNVPDTRMPSTNDGEQFISKVL